jgi:hypothetical protein
MKTVSNLVVASLCLGLSGVVYAEPAAMQPTKPVVSAPDTAKPKAAKHKLSAPTETSATPVTPAASDAKKSAEHREPALNAAPAAATSKVKPAVPATPASKDAKHAASTVSPVSKPVSSAEAPKAAK